MHIRIVILVLFRIETVEEVLNTFCVCICVDFNTVFSKDVY